MSAFFLFLAWGMTAALAAMLLIALWNAHSFLRLRAAQAPAEQTGRVSVLIPARNEAAIIGATVQRHLQQRYDQFELLVLDDASDDGTAEAVLAAAQGDPRVKVLAGAPLPPGWLGKPWACHQLGQAAVGDVLVFTDADVIWEPEALEALTALQQRSNADLLTVWPTQHTVTWSERLTVPLMAMAVLAYLPLPMANDKRMVQAAAANGQCMAFRRSAYAACGGHAAVSGRIVEDIALAEAIKRAGLNLRMADGNNLIACRMYQNAREVIDGYTKNILAGHRGSFALLALSTVVHLLLFVGPWAWLLWGLVRPGTPGWPLWPLALAALGVAIRAITAKASHQRVGDALLMPISALFMTAIAAHAVWRHLRYGGPSWKGRIVTERTTTATAGSTMPKGAQDG